MKKSGLLFVLTVIMLTCFNSCKKEIKTVWVYFDETGCLYPWGPYKQDGTQDQEIMDAVKKNIENQNVKIFEIKIVSDGVPAGQMLCTACNCKTHRRIHCRVNEKDVSVMLNNGFYE